MKLQSTFLFREGLCASDYFGFHVLVSVSSHALCGICDWLGSHSLKRQMCHTHLQFWLQRVWSFWAERSQEMSFDMLMCSIWSQQKVNQGLKEM